MNNYEKLDLINFFAVSAGLIMLTFLPQQWFSLYKILGILAFGVINGIIQVKMSDNDVRTHIKNDPHSKEYSDWKFYLIMIDIVIGITGMVLVK